MKVIDKSTKHKCLLFFFIFFPPMALSFKHCLFCKVTIFSKVVPKTGSTIIEPTFFLCSQQIVFFFFKFLCVFLFFLVLSFPTCFLSFIECLCISATLGAYPAESKPKCGVGPTDFSRLRELLVLPYFFCLHFCKLLFHFI